VPSNVNSPGTTVLLGRTLTSMGNRTTVFFKEFWKWQAWPSFDWLYPRKKDKTNGYFLLGGVVYLATVGYIVYVNSG